MILLSVVMAGKINGKKQKQNIADETVNEHKKHMFVDYIVGPQMMIVCTCRGVCCVLSPKINRSALNFF